MQRRLRLLPIVLASIPLTFSACGGPGAEDTATTSTSTPGETKTGASQEGAKNATTPPEDVTPVSGIDPKKQIDIVKEEVQGGEAQSGGTPFDYLWQPAKTAPAPDEPVDVDVPTGLNALTPVVYVPAANPITKAKLELGKQLYFDPRVSKDGTVSCATCHNPEKGWTDQAPFSAGIDGQTGSRSAPTVLNTVYGKSMFWDGRAPSLEGQAQGPIQNPIEMGTQSYKEIVTRLRAIPGYQEQFKKVFGTDVTLDGMAKAIATFERTALSGNSAFDKYNTDGDFKALDESAKRGMVLFGLRLGDDDPDKETIEKAVTLKKANCTSCHIGFNFTDEQFHNLGVGFDASKNEFADLGRWAISPIGAKFNSELGSFKTPTIRDAVNTAPYMHDGSEKTLEDVVEYYDRGGNANPHLDKDMKKLNLTPEEKKDVVAFMKALTGAPLKVELPTLPDGPEGTAPDPRKALTPPAPKSQAAAFDPHGVLVVR
jgi:cytochrome c peroxidase